MAPFHTHSGWWILDRRQLSHDILNHIERLRIMHDLARDQDYSVIKKEELLTDLAETIRLLEANFRELAQ
jgi:hypothetical protein